MGFVFGLLHAYLASCRGKAQKLTDLCAAGQRGDHASCLALGHHLMGPRRGFPPRGAEPFLTVPFSLPALHPGAGQGGQRCPQQQQHHASEQPEPAGQHPRHPPPRAGAGCSLPPAAALKGKLPPCPPRVPHEDAPRTLSPCPAMPVVPHHGRSLWQPRSCLALEWERCKTLRNKMWRL